MPPTRFKAIFTVCKGFVPNEHMAWLSFGSNPVKTFGFRSAFDAPRYARTILLR